MGCTARNPTLAWWRVPRTEPCQLCWTEMHITTRQLCGADSIRLPALESNVEPWNPNDPNERSGLVRAWNVGRYDGSCRGNFDLQAPGFSFCWARCAPKKEPVVPQNVGADSHLFRNPRQFRSPSSPLGHGEMFWIRSYWDCICWRVYHDLKRGSHNPFNAQKVP